MTTQPPKDRMLKSGHSENRFSISGSSPIRPPSVADVTRPCATTADILGARHTHKRKGKAS